MEFFAYHGCYEAEQIVGNRFLVDLALDTDTTVPSQTDDLQDALNYAKAYEIVKEQMQIRSNLLEHVVCRILNSLHEAFPQLEKATVKIAKLYPPVGGQVRSVSVEMTE